LHCESHPHAYRQSSRDIDRLTPHVTGYIQNHAIGAVGFSPRSPAAPPFCFKKSVNLAMTGQELVLSALRQLGLIIAEHLELGATDADEAITQLVKVLDTKELADAINRLERGYGLRVVK
jgi:hypothetical protein